jgi:hypothetical protein
MIPSGSGAPVRHPLFALALPFGFIGLLAAFAALPEVRSNTALFWSFGGAASVLLAWWCGLFAVSAHRHRRLAVAWVLRRPHWVQPLVQLSLYVYWGLSFPLVAASAYLIAAQLVFAYAFDMLLSWSRQDSFELGFGPFPVVLSINLFLWFKPDWFYLQFVMIAVGFAAKALIRWQKDGRPAHIFNPSSFPLAVMSLFLIATGTVDHTWGREIAVTIGVPAHIFEFLFLISIPGQIFFGVASMTMPAVLTSYLLSAAYFGVTGTYFFFGPIPTAAFLGMLLLFTDPSTAPRSDLGRTIYGVLYGASVFVLYGLLDLLGQPTFYDKLLFVPFLNLGVRMIDRLASSPALARFDPARLGRRLVGRRRNLAFTGIWASVFVALLALHGIGDTHPANRLPFWERACEKGLRNGCRNLETMQSSFCESGSAWACNEFGIHSIGSDRFPADQRAGVAAYSFDRACALGSAAGCGNARALSEKAGQATLRHGPPRTEDYAIVLDAKGLPRERTPLELWQRACSQGWQDGCEKVAAVGSPGGPGQSGVPPAARLSTACAAGDSDACHRLGLMYRRGDGVPRDDRRALSCELGVVRGCVTSP